MAATSANAGNVGYTIPTFIGWGNANGSNTTTVTLPASAPTSTQGTGQWFDIAPFNESAPGEARVQASGTSVTNNVLASGTVTTQFIGTITATNNHNNNTAGVNTQAAAIGESFLVFSATPSTLETTLFTAITSGATSMTVSTAWPTITGSVPFYVQLNNEVIKVSATATTTTATIVRAQNGSAANAGAAGDGISLGNIPGAGSSNPNKGDLFAHAGFTALALNNGDSIQFTWQINVTS